MLFLVAKFKFRIFVLPIFVYKIVLITLVKACVSSSSHLRMAAYDFLSGLYENISVFFEFRLVEALTPYITGWV